MTSIPTTQPLTPTRYNITLTKDGAELNFVYPVPSEEEIARFGYVIPTDVRCNKRLIHKETDMYDALRAVLGSTYNGNLAYMTKKQVVISLHDTAILGYQRQDILDPRIGAKVATFWEIYCDQRIWPASREEKFQKYMSEVVSEEYVDPESDKKFVDDIQRKLLENARVL